MSAFGVDLSKLPELYREENKQQDAEKGQPDAKTLRASDVFTILASGCALISDGLQNNIMNLTNVVLGRILGSKVYTSTWSTRVSNSLTVGTIIGQLAVGLICDRIGRKSAILTATVLIVLGIILVTAAHGANGSVEGFLWFLVIARGITGVGVGGEYPASSTSAAEAANEVAGKWRGPLFIMCTNFVLSFGGPLASIIYLIVTSAATENHLPTIWRTVFGISAIFPVVVLFFRWRMLNSKLYRKSAMRQNTPYLLVIRRYWRRLIGTAGAWFLYDFVVFPNGAFSSTIISQVVGSNSSLIKIAEWQLLLGTIALPGVFIGALLCNPLGRKNTMMLGFAGFLVVGLIVGCAYDRLVKIVPLFVIFYGLIASVGNLGDFLGLISSESYPTAVRGTCYGLSAAVGKAGAAIGTQAFNPIKNNLGIRWVFIISACCGVAGVLITYFFVPDLTPEDLAREDKEWQDYLVAHGWKGVVGEGSEQRVLGSQETFVVDDKSSLEDDKR